jgi:ubiquinone/menaquinone biosynthesis C-methylase UbiE
MNRFGSVGTRAEKVSILCELAQPGFSPDLIKFLHKDDPALWAAQDQILTQHGCAATVSDSKSWKVLETEYHGRTLTAGDTVSCDLMIPKIPGVYDANQDLLGKYILPKLTVDFLTNVISLNELNRPDIKILDIGTGCGEILQQLRDHNITSLVHGLDSPERIPYYVSKSVYDEFVESDIRYLLPMQDNTYDIILCSNVFMQSVMDMENDPALSEDCLDEILRILVPGGIFVVNVDRFGWAAIDQKLNQLPNINILKQTWVYHRDRLCMFPPTRLCIAVQKH